MLPSGFIKHLVLLSGGEGEIQTAHTSCKCPSPAVGRLEHEDGGGTGAIWLCPEVCACLLQ